MELQVLWGGEHSWKLLVLTGLPLSSLLTGLVITHDRVLILFKQK